MQREFEDYLKCGRLDGLCAEATYISKLVYVASDDLRVIDFDGTSFLGGFTTLEPNLIPTWTGMSLVVAAPQAIPAPATLPLLTVALAVLALVGCRKWKVLGRRLGGEDSIVRKLRDE